MCQKCETQRLPCRCNKARTTINQRNLTKNNSSSYGNKQTANSNNMCHSAAADFLYLQLEMEMEVEVNVEVQIEALPQPLYDGKPCHCSSQLQSIEKLASATATVLPAALQSWIACSDSSSSLYTLLGSLWNDEEDSLMASVSSNGSDCSYSNCTGSSCPNLIGTSVQFDMPKTVDHFCSPSKHGTVSSPSKCLAVSSPEASGGVPIKQKKNLSNEERESIVFHHLLPTYETRWKA